ncbi:methylated-DNA--[protein]-cysteine S-methyltransferase [Bordetella bronchiseptica]|uniref:methylated-DNA--[protein]-cysteine S-methyltransferase n=1 Tax=Bordetella bronchiseptica TaxID=518 RepID=UPI0005286C94|nr:methylated-DNA--[protein]-cysteine S-methyltransferase [Bordetella bronchiseptica]AWQ07581.1 cysteine methyltransferase [Bordetella bronchiseptica]QIY00560.1 methylated-DNA--[protein]-cysteine S-methyltransferase [Bordetella bronchiseptica]RSB98219.1 methylated-DNA--[protein]-cysteine S-methyltransferase [Bordetella bronchiseptica]RSC07277.1 methylated-DNA--[protein]-cysteine S-methyltransferase [Bordetella bronchiseptica]
MRGTRAPHTVKAPSNQERIMQFFQAQLESPLGALSLVTDDRQQVRALEFADSPQRLRRLLHLHYGTYTLREAPAPAAIVTALAHYFSGQCDALDGIATATGGSALQQRVWQALRRIPAGEVTSYGALARQLGHDDRQAARAIGGANAANPIAIIVPCHRVIGKDGALKGYAWGLERKRWLLAHENAAAGLLREGG